MLLCQCYPELSKVMVVAIILGHWGIIFNQTPPSCALTCHIFVIHFKAFVNVYIKSHLNGFVLGIGNSSPNEAAIVELSPASNPSTINQFWHVDVQHDGTFLLVSEMNGKVLECGNGGSGTALRVCNLKDPENRRRQCWRVEGNSLVSALSNNIISIQEGNVWPQASVCIQTRCSPVAEWQKFELIEVCWYSLC